MATITAQGFDGLYMLVHDSDKRPANIGDNIKKRGVGRTYAIVSGNPPGRPRSTGSVTMARVTDPGDPPIDAQDIFQPWEFDLRWVPYGRNVD